MRFNHVFAILIVGGLSVLSVGCGDDDGGGGSEDAGADSGPRDAGRDASDMDAHLNDGGADASAQDAASDSGLEGLIRLGNISNATCAETPTNSLSPVAGEEGHWSAGVLTPSSYPFQVLAIEYKLKNFPQGGVSDICHSGAPHRVQVYKATETPGVDGGPATVKPPGTPSVLAEFSVDLEASTETQTFVTVQRFLTTPITLNSGEHLVIAVEMTGLPEYPDVLCVATCPQPQDVDTDFWSNSTGTPYPWASLKSFNINTNITVRAYGSALD